MDEVSKRCLRELSVSISLRLAVSALLFFVSMVSESSPLFKHFAVLILVWIAAETLFIFLPNFIRHQNRWKLYENYRIQSSVAAKKNGGLKTIYSKLLDNYPHKSAGNN